VWTGSGYGVAWGDSRDGNTEIYFARLTEYGEKVGDDVRVTSSPGSSSSPSLVWTGSGYGVTWEDFRSENGVTYFARISVDGVEMGDDVRITPSPGWSRSPSLVWTGSGGFGVAWSGDRDGNEEIYFTRLGSCADE
jgi:hypothetical protein